MSDKNKETLTELASREAHRIRQEHPALASAIVILIRNDDDTVAAATNTDLSLIFPDTVIAVAAEMLGAIRRQLLSEMLTRLAEDPQGDA